MRLLIATPLYPPDIAPLAVYVKECAKRLNTTATITILAYAHIPEKVEQVKIVTVPKNIPLLFRLIIFTYRLWKESQKADVVFIQNGASVELSAGLVGLVCNTPQVLRLADPVALQSANKRWLLSKILHLALSQATHIIEEQTIITHGYIKKTTRTASPLSRPEIHPFDAYPKEALEQYEKSWNEYLMKLTQIFIHAKR